jgi:hypothetical protein
LKVFYWDPQIQKRNYFLLNTYQRSSILPHLKIGSVRNVLLVQGYKYQFLSRINPMWHNKNKSQYNKIWK